MLQLLTFSIVFSMISNWHLTVIEELIIGGETTKIQEVPYQAAFYYYGQYFCAGSVISRIHILTAAHCVAYLPKAPEGLSVRVGSSKMYSGGQLVQVEQIYVHPKFMTRFIDFDVGVVELKSPLKFSEVVKPLNIGDREPKEGELVRVSGWGYTKEIGPPSRKLRSVHVHMVHRKNCEKSYEKILPITKRMVCAAGEGKDACYGDSGGPLVYNDKIIGIVSTGEGCARKEYPGIYTNVADSQIRNFIRKIIKEQQKKYCAAL